MLILGLTGSIGMGKSTTAAMFRAAGVRVHDADATVHRLYAGRAAPLIEEAFPGSTENGIVRRDRLAEAVLGKPEAIRRLEGLIHPLVREEEQAFLASAEKAGCRQVVLDIPLLFETGTETRADLIVLVSAPAAVQKARVLTRPGMTEQKFAAILARQMPDADKRRRSHYLIDTSLGLAAAARAVTGLLVASAGMPGRRRGEGC